MIFLLDLILQSVLCSFSLILRGCFWRRGVLAHPQNPFLHPCRYDPSTAFLCYPCTTAYPFDGTLTTGEIGGCEFSNPVASALNTFLNPYSYCVLSDPLHWVTEPAPLDEDHNISFFFTENLCYSGTITPSTIFWTFMTIHNSSQSHYHII